MLWMWFGNFWDFMWIFWPNFLASVEIMHVLWFYGFSVSYELWNGMILVWLYFLLNSGHFGILHAIFGRLCTKF